MPSAAQSSFWKRTTKPAGAFSAEACRLRSVESLRRVYEAATILFPLLKSWD
jgi:hypothetical protein